MWFTKEVSKVTHEMTKFNCQLKENNASNKICWAKCIEMNSNSQGTRNPQVWDFLLSLVSGYSHRLLVSVVSAELTFSFVKHRGTINFKILFLCENSVPTTVT
ncbi:hypothetical protein KIL84_022488 [Mauremys mutica]|uniref:Uncharacterized protein n=1 Tax=Mauremys mutica TaxID=74926 RepID=A0A9D3WNI9_9SAUR|nr:hypothetical protein KIL84_022488 [Mauremys mutica]